MTADLPVVTGAEEAGPRRPSTGTPARGAGTVRRTSSVDVTRPEGIPGPLRAEGRARDTVTQDVGAPPVAETHQVLAVVLDPFQEVRAISADPPAPLDPLIGARAASGFRARAAATVPEHRRDASLLHLLLDDLPAAALVSGYALQRAGVIGAAPPEVFAPNVDLCAGWAADATVFRTIHEHGTVPMTMGPPAPRLDDPDDPDGWHELPAALPHTVRRRRRIDLAAGDALRVDAMFRDSYFDADGAESVVHEYGLTATIDAETFVIAAADATPRVLPYVECPSAAASAARIVGLQLDELRDRVRAEWVGPSTCTHLNDLLRSLEDVRALLHGRAR